MCVLCQTVQDFTRALPPVCPKCHAKGHWRSVESENPPAVDYTVTHNDQRFLHSLKIDPEA